MESKRIELIGVESRIVVTMVCRGQGWDKDLLIGTKLQLGES
jgi:hypothetical protein